MVKFDWKPVAPCLLVQVEAIAWVSCHMMRNRIPISPLHPAISGVRASHISAEGPDAHGRAFADTAAARLDVSVRAAPPKRVTCGSSHPPTPPHPGPALSRKDGAHSADQSQPWILRRSLRFSWLLSYQHLMPFRRVSY